jgi:hypothetical protein
MRSRHQQIIQKRKSKAVDKPLSINDILRASYRRFTKDKHTRQAVSLVLR